MGHRKSEGRWESTHFEPTINVLPECGGSQFVRGQVLALAYSKFGAKGRDKECESLLNGDYSLNRLWVVISDPLFTNLTNRVLICPITQLKDKKKFDTVKGHIIKKLPDNNFVLEEIIINTKCDNKNVALLMDKGVGFNDFGYIQLINISQMRSIALKDLRSHWRHRSFIPENALFLIESYLKSIFKIRSTFELTHTYPADIANSYDDNSYRNALFGDSQFNAKYEELDKVVPTSSEEDIFGESNDILDNKSEVSEDEDGKVRGENFIVVKELAKELNILPSLILKDLFLKGRVATLYDRLTLEEANEISSKYKDNNEDTNISEDIEENDAEQSGEDSAVLVIEDGEECIEVVADKEDSIPSEDEDTKGDNIDELNSMIEETPYTRKTPVYTKKSSSKKQFDKSKRIIIDNNTIIDLKDDICKELKVYSPSVTMIRQSSIVMAFNISSKKYAYDPIRIKVVEDAKKQLDIVPSTVSFQPSTAIRIVRVIIDGYINDNYNNDVKIIKVPKGESLSGDDNVTVDEIGNEPTVEETDNGVISSSELTTLNPFIKNGISKWSVDDGMKFLNIYFDPKKSVKDRLEWSKAIISHYGLTRTFVNNVLGSPISTVYKIKQISKLLADNQDLSKDDPLIIEKKYDKIFDDVMFHLMRDTKDSIDYLTKPNSDEYNLFIGKYVGAKFKEKEQFIQHAIDRCTGNK